MLHRRTQEETWERDVAARGGGVREPEPEPARGPLAVPRPPAGPPALARGRARRVGVPPEDDPHLGPLQLPLDLRPHSHPLQAAVQQTGNDNAEILSGAYSENQKIGRDWNKKHKIIVDSRDE